jgi:hypothetical protein
MKLANALYLLPMAALVAACGGEATPEPETPETPAAEAPMEAPAEEMGEEMPAEEGMGEGMEEGTEGEAPVE